MIPSFLQPPTDNLYKFLAIAGMLAFFAAIFLDYENLEQLRKSKEEKEYLAIEIDFLVAKSNRLSAVIEMAEKDIRRETRQESQQHDSGYSAREVEGMQIERLDLEHELAIKRAHVKILNDRLDDILQRLHSIFYFVCVVTGVMVSSLGFSLWYLRVQLPIDQKLKRSGVRRKRKLPPFGSAG